MGKEAVETKFMDKLSPGGLRFSCCYRSGNRSGYAGVDLCMLLKVRVRSGTAAAETSLHACVSFPTSKGISGGI